MWVIKQKKERMQLTLNVIQKKSSVFCKKKVLSFGPNRTVEVLSFGPNQTFGQSLVRTHVQEYRKYVKMYCKYGFNSSGKGGIPPLNKM
jgi:hypothetical protein